MKRVTRTFTTPEPPKNEEGQKKKPVYFKMQEQPRFGTSEESKQQEPSKLTAYGKDLSWLAHLSDVHRDGETKSVPQKKDYRAITVVCKPLGYKSEPLFVHKNPIGFQQASTFWSNLTEGHETQREIAYLDADTIKEKGLLVFTDSSQNKPVGTAKWTGPLGSVGEVVNEIQFFDCVKTKNGLFAALDFATSRLMLLHVNEQATTVWRSSSYLSRCRKLFPKGRPSVNNNSMIVLPSGMIVYLGMQSEWEFDKAQPILFNPETRIEQSGFITGVGCPSECLAVSPRGFTFYIGSKGGIVTAARLDGGRAVILSQLCLSDKLEVRSQGSKDVMVQAKLESSSLYTLVNIAVSPQYVIVLYQTNNMAEAWMLFLKPEKLHILGSKRIRTIGQSSHLKVLRGSALHKSPTLVCIYGRNDVQLFGLLPKDDGFLTDTISMPNLRNLCLINCVHFYPETKLLVFAGLGKKLNDTDWSERYSNIMCYQLFY